MKTLHLASIVCVAILLVAPASVQAQDFRSPNGGPGANANQSRSFLGLPMPQQWSGNRGAASNQYSGQFTNGQCTTGNCPDRRNAAGNITAGNRPSGNCHNCNCPNGACVRGLCANGQCQTCANGQCAGCAGGKCSNGQSVAGNCPDGQCRANQNLHARYNSGVNPGAQGNRSTRTMRSNPADPFRQAEYKNENDSWSPRPASRIPVNELYPSRYNRTDLDLRRPYFNNQSGALNQSRNGNSSAAARDTWEARPTDRSFIGAPVERHHGLSQI